MKPQSIIDLDRGKRLKILRVGRDMSQQEVGDSIGKTKATISRIEKGDSFNLDTLKALAKAFDVTEDYLMNGNPGTKTISSKVNENQNEAKNAMQNENYTLLKEQNALLKENITFLEAKMARLEEDLLMCQAGKGAQSA